MIQQMTFVNNALLFLYLENIIMEIDLVKTILSIQHLILCIINVNLLRGRVEMVFIFVFPTVLRENKNC